MQSAIKQARSGSLMGCAAGVSRQGKSETAWARLAAGQLPVSEHHVRPAALTGEHLAREALHEGCGAHDAVREVALAAQRLLKAELRLLERKQRFLHADGAEQHKVLRALRV
jgi:hypothetical protein